MSVRVIKKGLLDTMQDNGRYGYQHLGINPGGVMDPVAAAVANMLAGNDDKEPVLELHYPAASFVFQSTARIALSGADFGAVLNKQSLPVDKAVTAAADSLLEFTAYKKGARCYLAVHGGWQCEQWLNSCSTNLKVAAGGYKGRALQKEDIIAFNTDNIAGQSAHSSVFIIDTADLYRQTTIRCIKGNAFEELNRLSKEKLFSASFGITPQSDRMGYRLEGEKLVRKTDKEVLSAAVTRGTIQLLPSGELILLMADHQTTGGYPVVAHVISADIPAIAQKRPNEKIQFTPVSIEEAETALLQQSKRLEELRYLLTYR